MAEYMHERRRQGPRILLPVGDIETLTSSTGSLFVVPISLAHIKDVDVMHGSMEQCQDTRTMGSLSSTSRNT